VLGPAVAATLAAALLFFADCPCRIRSTERCRWITISYPASGDAGIDIQLVTGTVPDIIAG